MTMSGSGTHDDVVLGVPYGPWRRWVRALRARGGRRRALADGADPHERAYLVYGLVLLTAMYAPILWSALSLAAAPLGAADGGARDALVATGAVVLGLSALAGVLLPRFGVPLWVTPTEAGYALSGIWDPRVVLWRRVVVLVVATGTAATVVGSALAAGALDAAGDDAGPGVVLAWGACAAGAAMLPLAVAVAAQCPRWRATARGVAVVVAVLGVLVAWQGPGVVQGAACTVSTGCSPALLGPPAETVGWAVALAVVACWVLVAVLPRYLDVDGAAAAGHRVAVTGAALQGGDATGMRGGLAPSRRARRTAGLPVRVAMLSPVVARDLLGLRRRPGPVLVSLGAGAVGVLLVTTAEAGVLGAMLGAVVLYAAAGVWTGGLRSMAEQPVPGGLLPGTPRRAVAAHLVVPACLALVVGSVGLGLAPVGGSGGGWPAGAVVAGVLVAVLGARAWVAGASAVPAALFTPVPGPTGDLAMVSVAAWFLRGWLVVVAVAWAADRWGAVVTVLAVGLAWLLVGSAVRRLGRE
jgi:hypothetical protein